MLRSLWIRPTADGVPVDGGSSRPSGAVGTASSTTRAKAAAKSKLRLPKTAAVEPPSPKAAAAAQQAHDWREALIVASHALKVLLARGCLADDAVRHSAQAALVNMRESCERSVPAQAASTAAQALFAMGRLLEHADRAAP